MRNFNDYFLIMSSFLFVVCILSCFYRFIVNNVVELLKIDVKEFMRVVIMIVIIRLCMFIKCISCFLFIFFKIL